MLLMSVQLWWLWLPWAIALSPPSQPFLELAPLSGSTALATLGPPISDGGSPILSYKVEWDTDPGVREVQTITTSVYLGPNEVQSVTTYAPNINEVQFVNLTATAVSEVQSITVSSATGGYFFLELDTSASGGSLQYSGFIAVNAPASGQYLAVDRILSAMSNVKPYGAVSASLVTIDASNYQYLVTFPAAMGQVPQLVQHTADLTPFPTANVLVATVTPGNVVGGSFTLSFQGATTADIAADASEGDLRLALEALPGVGTVAVARSAATAQHGYLWTVEFTSPLNSGNVDNLVPDYANLTVSSPGAAAQVVVTSLDGNQLGGGFSLTFSSGAASNTTGQIAYNASADQFKAAIESLPLIPAGTTAVSRAGPDGQLGYTWTVSFLSNFLGVNQGLLAPLAYNASALTGRGAGVSVGVVRAGTFKEVQQIAVATTATSIDPLRMMRLQFNGQVSSLVDVRPSGGVCISSITEVQTITSSTVDTTSLGGDFDVSLYLQFRLVYGSSATALIDANPSGSTDCSAAAAAIRAQLQLLPDFFQVSVLGLSTGATQGCVWTVIFVSSIGDVAPLQVQAYNRVSFSTGATGLSSVAGDDTLRTATLVNGEKDAIKAELERLSSVGSVTVTSSQRNQSAAGECVWQVTFDTNAGSPLPLMQVSLFNDTLSNVSSSYSTSTTLGTETVTVSRLQAATSQALGGEFSLSFRGARSQYLSYAASALDVQRALEQLDTVGSVAVSRSSADENSGYTWAVTFLSELGSLDLMLVDGTSLTGTVAAGAVAKLVTGALPPFNSSDPVLSLPLGSAVLTNLSQLSTVMTGLDQGIPYYVRGSASNAIGQSDFAYASDVFVVPQPQQPAAPVNASLLSVDGNTLAVTFDPPLLDGGSAVNFYKVEYSNSSFAAAVQQVSIQCAVTPEVQNISTSTLAIPEVQLVFISTTFQTGDTVTPEVQQVQCDATLGSFRLSFNGYVTTSIAYNADAPTIASALQQLQIVNAVSVAFVGGATQACNTFASLPGGAFTVTFTSVVGLSGDLPLLTATTNSLQGLRRITVSELTRGVDSLGGTFRLSYRGSVTADLPAFATASQVAAALGDLDTLPFGGINVTDYSTLLVNQQGRLWAVTFSDPSLGGNLESLVVPVFFNALTGSDVAITVLADGAALSSADSTSAPPSVMGNELSGTFYLSLRGYSVGPIDYNVADTVLATQLESLPNLGAVAVTRFGPSVRKEYTWLVTFASTPGYFPPGSGDLGLFSPDYLVSLGGNGSLVSVGSVSVGSPPLSGSFSLTMNNGTRVETTLDIPADASAGELQSALDQLTTVGAVSVTRTVTGSGYSWLVTFGGCKSLNGTDVCNEGPVPRLAFNDSGVLCSPSPMSVVGVVSGVGPAFTGLLTDLSGATPYTFYLNSLTAGYPYFVRVSAHNAQGYGQQSLTQPEFLITTYNPPGAPPSVRLVSSTISTISVEWDPPRDNGGAPVVGYELWMDDWAGGNPRLVYDGTDIVGVTAFTVGSVSNVVLSAGKSYRFMVRAVNYCISTKPTTICLGAFSAQSIFTARAPRAPLAPQAPYRSSLSNVGASATDASIVIRWVPPVDNGGSPVTSYLVDLAPPGTALYAEVDVGVPLVYDSQGTQILQWTFGNLTAGSYYRFFVVAVNAFGRSAASPILSVVAGVLPGVDVTGLGIYGSIQPAVTAIDSSSVSLSWPLPSSNSTGGSGITGWLLYEYPGVPLNTLATPVVVHQDVQLVSTALAPAAAAPLGGTFTLAFNGSETLDLPYNASASDLAIALEDLPGVWTVTVNRTVNANSGYDWTITFDAIAGDVALLAATSGRLTPASLASISVRKLVPGTPAVLAYDGSNRPEIRSVRVGELVPDTTYAFKVAPINALGHGILSAASVTVVTSSGASAAYTSASGSSLIQGITYGVDEEQIIHTANCANSPVRVFYGGSSFVFSANMSAAEVEVLLVSTFSLSAAVDKVYSVNASVDSVDWKVLFRAEGDVALLAATSTDVNCLVTVDEFVKGNQNEFTIAPKQLSGEVLRDTVTATGFAGTDLFFTESALNGSWYRDHGVARYNPLEYEVMTVIVPAAVLGGVVLTLPDYLTPGSSFNFSTGSFSGASDAFAVQAAVEALPNVKSVDVSRATYAGGVVFTVTFLSNLGGVPLLQSLNSQVLVNSVQTGICEVQAIVVATDTDIATRPSNGTFTVSYEGQYTTDINFDASEAEMKSALEGLSKIGTVKVDRQTNGNGYRWTVSFVSSVGDLRLVQAAPYRYAVQRVQTFGGSPTPLSGLLALSFGGDSVTVNYDASDADLASALESMPSVGAVEVARVVGSNGQFTWLITFRALIGSLNLLVTDTTQLLGSDASALVSEVVAGSAQTLVGYSPRLDVEEVVAGRPSYTGSYSVDVPGNYEVSVSQLVSGGLAGQYWDNQWQYGSPSVERVDPQIRFDWSTGLLTQFSYDYVSVRWAGKLSVPRTDEYVFYVQADDFAQVFLNHSLLLDASAVCCTEFRAQPVVLTAGVFYDILVTYVELTGAASVLLSYSSTTLKKQPVPSSALYYALPIVGSPFPVTIIPGAADYPYSTAFGSGLHNATAGVTASFYIQAKDADGNNQTINFELSNPDELLRVTVTSLGGGVVYYGEIAYLGLGLFRAQYLPLLAGAYSLRVQMGDWDIYCGLGEAHKCSPFSLLVAPGPTVSQMSEAESPSTEAMDFLVEAVAGQAAYFFIQAKDAYGNNRISGGDPWSVLFTSTSNAAIQFKGTVDDRGDGTYDVRYTVPYAGSYDVAVTLQSQAFLVEPLQSCLAASAPFIFSRAYNGLTPYVTPAFCSLAHPVLRVVHSAFYAPSSTYDEGPLRDLSFATTGVPNSFTVESRDFFGNLREGDNTTHFAGNGDGSSDYFTVEFSKSEIGYSFLVSSAIDVISATSAAAGFFRLSFAGVTTQNLPSTISAAGLEAVLETALGGALHVSVSKTVTLSPSLLVSWSVQFLSMFDEWQSLTGRLQLTAPLGIVGDPFYQSMTQRRPASRGVYPVSFTLWITGTYNVHVRSGGTDIQGSPLSLQVGNGPVDPTASLTYGEGLTRAVAGSPASFLVQARDARQTEVQSLALRGLYPVTGSFFMTFKGERTADIPSTADANTVRAALEALYSIGSVAVTLDTFPVVNNGSVEVTAMSVASVWTVTFNGSCAGSAGGSCPSSLGDEPALAVNSDLLVYSASPANSHITPPEVAVTEHLRGYPGNNISTSGDLSAIAVALTHRTGSARLGMNVVQRLFCNGTSGTLSFQFLGRVYSFSAGVTASFVADSLNAASLADALSADPHALTGAFVATAPSTLICSAIGANSDFMFTSPVGAPLPLFDILPSSTFATLTASVSYVVEGVDSLSAVPGSSGLYRAVYTPTVSGVYDISVRINAVEVSTDLGAGVSVAPALEYSATATHNMSQVAVEGARQYLSVLLRDKFGNPVDGPLQPDSALVVTLAGLSDPCQSSTGVRTNSCIAVSEVAALHTDGLYSFVYDPTIAGSYTASVRLRTKGGLAATYFRTANLSSALVGSHDYLFDGTYHSPYWCDGLDPGTYSPLWSFGALSYCDPTISSCGCSSSRLDSMLAFSWGLLPPLPHEELYSGSFPSDFFSAQWTGYVTAPASGLFTFTVFADYGVTVSLGGVAVLQASPMKTASVTFSAALSGLVATPIVISYFHQTEEAYLRVLWAGPGLPAGTSVLDGSYLSFEREIAGSPLTVEVYPGAVSSAASFANGTGLTDCMAMSSCSFVVQARDAAGNNVFNAGDELWNVTVRGVGDWAGFSGASSRINDVNQSAVQHVSASVAPLGWVYVSTADAVFLQKFITVNGDVSGVVSRGDSLRVGAEVLMVSYTGTFSVTGGISTVPLSRPYLGASVQGVPVFKVANCTTGKYAVSYLPTVRGQYAVNVMTPAVDEVQRVRFASLGALNGSYTLSVRVQSLGQPVTQTTAPLFLGSGGSSGAAIQSAMQQLSNLAAVAVNATGCVAGASVCAFEVTFLGLDQDLPLLLVDAGGVSGNALEVEVTEVQAGAAAADIAGSPFTLTVLPGDTDAAFTTAYGQGLITGVTGAISNLTIQAKDGYGNNRLDAQARSSFRVHAFVAQDAFGDPRSTAEGAVSYAGDGAYGATYTPVASGIYTVALLLSERNEVQNLTASWSSLSTRGGFFMLTYGPCSALNVGCATTGRLAFDSSAAAVKAAIEALPGAGSVSVSYSQASDYLSAAWTVTFASVCDMQPLLVYDATFSLNATTAEEGQCAHIATSLNGSLPFPYVNTLLVEEVQQLTIDAAGCVSLAACNFALAFRGFTTATLSYTASAALVTSALEAIASVGSVDVTLATAGLVSTFTVTFRPSLGSMLAHIETYGDLPMLLVISSDLPPSSVSVLELTPGYSPFTAVVTAETVVASSCTAVDSPGVAGFNGLSTGIYQDTTSFRIESRDAFGNRVFLGPRREVQVVETFSNGSAPLAGSFLVSYGMNSVQLSAGAGIDAFKAALESSLFLGAVDVTTNSAATPSLLTADVVYGALDIHVSADPSTAFSVGAWIRLTDNVTGPVYTVASLDPSAQTITLSKPYSGATALLVPLFYQPNSSFQYIVAFDSLLGDLPALTVDATGLTGVAGAGAVVTACDYLTTQLVQTSSTGALAGTFYLKLGAGRTPDLPYNVSALALQTALLNIDGIGAVQVARKAAQAGVGAYAWTVSILSSDPSSPVAILAEGGLLRGQHAAISVNNNFCPASLSIAGTPAQSESGRVGETFFAELIGGSVANGSKVGGVVSYIGNGVFGVSYVAPREGLYNLSIAKADKGGLVGIYYNNRWLFGEPAFSRLDPVLAFNWTADDTLTPTGKDYISIRWTGYILPAFSEEYTFVVTVDDGARLFIDDVLVLDEFNNTVADGSGPAVFTALSPRSLVANQLVSIKIEFRENTGAAVFILGWFSPSQPYQVVPTYRLFPSLRAIASSPYTVQPTSRKPTPVTGTALSVLAWDALRVSFAPPLDDGGSPIVSYGVEWFSAHDPYGSNEVKTIKVSKTATGGSFALTYAGLQYWYPVPFNADAATIASVLESMPGIGAVTVHDGSDATSYSWVITFASNLGQGQGTPLNPAVSSLGVDGAGLISSSAGLTPLAVVCQNGTATTAGTLSCLVDDSVAATASLVNGSYSGSAAYPASVNASVNSQGLLTYDIPGLRQSSAASEGFTVRVYAANQAGKVSAPSAPLRLKPMALPDVPAYVETINVSGADDAVNVYWTAVSFPEDRASPVASFQVQWALEPRFKSPSSYTGLVGVFPSSRVAVGANAVLQYTVAGLIPGQKYYMRVCSINAVGMSC